MTTSYEGKCGKGYRISIFTTGDDGRSRMYDTVHVERRSPRPSVPPEVRDHALELGSRGRDRSSPDCQGALTELCEKYWYPLYAYVRRRVHDVQEAQDLTQAFFATLLDKNYIADADPQRGKFRTFLLSSLTHFLANEWDNCTF